MHHTDEKRPAHGFEWMAVAMILLRLFMDVEMRVSFGIMCMRVQMDLSGAEGAPQDVQSKQHQHDRDEKLEASRNRIGYRDAQTDYQQTDEKQRRRVTQTPKSSDQRRPLEILMLADNGRHRDQMIGIERMLYAEQETQTEGGD